MADDVAAELVLELGLPVEADGAGDVAGVVGLGVDVDLDEADAGVAEVLLDPVGVDENFGMCVLAAIMSVLPVVIAGSSGGGAFGQLGNVLDHVRDVLEDVVGKDHDAEPARSSRSSDAPGPFEDQAGTGAGQQAFAARQRSSARR